MQPRDPSIKFYSGDALSELDKKQANLMYGCQSKKNKLLDKIEDSDV